MGLLNKLFGGHQSLDPEVEESLVQVWVQMSGRSVEEAKSLVKTSIQSAKEEARKAGTDKLPSNFGDLLLGRENTDAKLRSEFHNKRLEGVTDNDIRSYWNMNDIERRVLENMQQAMMYSTWKGARETGRTDIEAAVYARKFFPYYGDPQDTRVTSDDDRPLPIELLMRENVWYAKEMNRNPVEFNKRLQEYSSFNALMRAEIRAGRL